MRHLSPNVLVSHAAWPTLGGFADTPSFVGIASIARRDVLQYFLSAGKTGLALRRPDRTRRNCDPTHRQISPPACAGGFLWDWLAPAAWLSMGTVCPSRSLCLSSDSPERKRRGRGNANPPRRQPAGGIGPFLPTPRRRRLDGPNASGHRLGTRFHVVDTLTWTAGGRSRTSTLLAIPACRRRRERDDDHLLARRRTDVVMNVDRAGTCRTMHERVEF